MIQSINTDVYLVKKGTAHFGFPEYGKIMIGDKGFEFYTDRDVSKFIQIPWDEVDYVIVSVVFKGKWIPRYAIQTKANGKFIFSSKNPKEVLREIRDIVGHDRVVRSLSFFDVLKRKIKTLLNIKTLES